MKEFIMGMCAAILLMLGMGYAKAETFDCSSSTSVDNNDMQCRCAITGCINWYNDKQGACDDLGVVMTSAGTWGAGSVATCGDVNGIHPNHVYIHIVQASGNTLDQGYSLNTRPPPCTPPETWQPSIQACGEACTAPAVWDDDLATCVTPVDCASTLGQTYQGWIQTAGPMTNDCSGGCQYEPTDFTFTDQERGYWTFTGTGNSCTGAPAPNPELLPEPVPVDPIEPTEPQPAVQDDGDTVDEPATDENQEKMSGQLEGIQEQLKNLEQGSKNETNLGNTANSLLTEIANELKEQGEGNEDGQGDEDGDGEEDSFGDNSCANPPSCNGDTLKCAIAEQAYFTRCNLQDETTDITEADVMAQVGQTQTLEQYFDETAPENIVDIENMWTAPAEVTGSCPADYSVSTSLGSFSFSWSYLCDLGSMVRPIIILSGYIIVSLMFYGSLLREW